MPVREIVKYVAIGVAILLLILASVYFSMSATPDNSEDIKAEADRNRFK